MHVIFFQEYFNKFSINYVLHIITFYLSLKNIGGEGRLQFDFVALVVVTISILNLMWL